MEDNKDNSVKETEQKPQEKAEGKTGGKTMAEMKGQQWEKGWIDGGGRTQGLPQNLSGRRYSGHNDFFLQLHTAINGYDAPVYATYKQIRDAGATVNKGEKAMPVIYWNISHKDENGQKISDEAFDAMTKAEL